jgi:hypothetical protein
MRYGPPIHLPCPDDVKAAERGRLLAARALAHDPEQRVFVEHHMARQLGSMTAALAYLRQRYPECYTPKPFFRNLLDLITFKRL